MLHLAARDANDNIRKFLDILAKMPINSNISMKFKKNHR